MAGSPAVFLFMLILFFSFVRLHPELADWAKIGIFDLIGMKLRNGITR